MFSAFRSPFLFPIFHFLQLSVSISCWSSNPGVSIPGAGGSGPNIPALKFLVFLQTLIALVHVCVIAFGAKLCRTKAGMGNPDQTPLEEIIWHTVNGPFYASFTTCPPHSIFINCFLNEWYFHLWDTSIQQNLSQILSPLGTMKGLSWQECWKCSALAPSGTLRTSWSISSEHTRQHVLDMVSHSKRIKASDDKPAWSLSKAKSDKSRKAWSPPWSCCHLILYLLCFDILPCAALTYNHHQILLNIELQQQLH